MGSGIAENPRGAGRCPAPYGNGMASVSAVGAAHRAAHDCIKKTAAPVGAAVLRLESAFLGQRLGGGDCLLLSHGRAVPPHQRKRWRGPRFFEIFGRSKSALRRDFAFGKMLGRRKGAGALPRPEDCPHKNSRPGWGGCFTFGISLPLPAPWRRRLPSPEPWGGSPHSGRSGR